MKKLILIHLLLAAVVLFFAGCAGTSDGDDNSGPPADDDSIDDTQPGDDSADDASDDSTDDTCDDTGDDDTLPPDTFGWIFLGNDRAYISETLAKAADYGIDHVQLSEDLIMEIDEINQDENRAAELQDIAQEAHSLGLEVWVWSHEFSNEIYLLCFDPEDALWDRRTKQYRDALTRIPEIDGVILMFGSSDVEPWYAPCFCGWCRDLPPTGNPVLDLIHSRPADRLQQIYEAVGGVVMGEFGRKLRVRTFMHQPLELKWLGESLRAYPDENLMAMNKDVPQDWQPYYPHEPLIGDVGHRHQIIEMDLGNEYWGESRILNSQVDYIYYRWSYDKAHGARGAAARIERGGDHAFGTPSEINIYAFSRLLQDETATPDDVYREWFDRRYGVDPDSPEAGALKEIFRNSHFAMRKMYYTLGFWSLEKGSDVTDSARYPAELFARNTASYDPAWSDGFEALANPKTQTLIDLWQESNESIELADDNLAALESVESAFSAPEDYGQLHAQLELHADCTRIWRLVKDTVFRYAHFVYGHPEDADYLEGNADRLLELADDMEAKWGANVSPGNPARIRNFVADLRESFPEQPDSGPWTQPRLFDISAEDLGGGDWRITWKSDAPMTSRVEWGLDLPVYDHDSGEQESLSTDHSVQIHTDDAQPRHVFRVSGHALDAYIRSGDFWLGLDP